MWTRVSAIALVAGVLVAACGDAGDGVGDAGDGVGGAPSDVTALPEPAPGPVPELPVSPESEAASPLPEIAVRRLNGDGGWVQLKNELPSDRPLLVWFWAPH